MKSGHLKAGKKIICKVQWFVSITHETGFIMPHLWCFCWLPILFYHNVASTMLFPLQIS